MITIYGENTTIEDLRKIKPAAPDGAGKRWKAIPHAELVDTIQAEVKSRGWRVREARYAIAREGADLAGAFLLEGVTGVDVPEGQTLALGFLNSNARRRALQITVGTEVAVCNNGMCSGNILLSRVHDHTVDLVKEVELAVATYIEHASTLVDEIQRLRSHSLTKGAACAILMEAARKRLMGWATMGRVYAEYLKPTFKEHGMDNSWALLNAFTYAARRKINPVNQMTVYNTFREMLPTTNQPCL